MMEADKPFRFNDVIAVLCALSPAFEAERVLWRFKQWQRNGQMSGRGVGRGAHYEYSLTEVWRAALLNEFQMIGVIPSVAVEMIERGGIGGTFHPNPATTTRIEVDMDRIATAIKTRAIAIEAGTGETRRRLDPEGTKARA